MAKPLRFMDKQRKIAEGLITQHGANAIDFVTPCTPLERVLVVELRNRKLLKIRRGS